MGTVRRRHRRLRCSLLVRRAIVGSLGTALLVVACASALVAQDAVPLTQAVRGLDGAGRSDTLSVMMLEGRSYEDEEP